MIKNFPRGLLAALELICSKDIRTRPGERGMIFFFGQEGFIFVLWGFIGFRSCMCVCVLVVVLSYKFVCRHGKQTVHPAGPACLVDDPLRPSPPNGDNSAGLDEGWIPREPLVLFRLSIITSTLSHRFPVGRGSGSLCNFSSPPTMRLFPSESVSLNDFCFGFIFWPLRLGGSPFLFLGI